MSWLEMQIGHECWQRHLSMNQGFQWYAVCTRLAAAESSLWPCVTKKAAQIGKTIASSLLLQPALQADAGDIL